VNGYKSVMDTIADRFIRFQQRELSAFASRPMAVSGSVHSGTGRMLIRGYRLSLASVKASRQPHTFSSLLRCVGRCVQDDIRICPC
jgi:hypothetical protein